MSRQGIDREVISARFKTNMQRIGAISTHLHSEAAGLGPAGLSVEGVKADLQRAVVVFLHATVEDFVRSHIKRQSAKFTFSSASSIKRVIERLGVDPNKFNDLYPALSQFAKRRNQIVHYADLDEKAHEAVKPWDLSDSWLLVCWHLAVSTLYYRLRQSTGPIDIVEERASQNMEKAFLQLFEIGRSFGELKGHSPEQQREKLAKIGESITFMHNTLKLDVNMFLDADGDPLDGVIRT
jgi:hypothetical protein